MTRTDQILTITADVEGMMRAKGYTNHYAEAFADGFHEGATWADKNPIVDLPKLLTKERRVWLNKACDVIRNTRMDDDLRSHLINSIMRL